MEPPARPRLADHVFARRHRHDGARIVVLHDTKRDVTVRVAERAWTLISGMDGTRDLAGLAAFVMRRGVTLEDAEIAGFVAELAKEALIEDGPAAVDPPRGRSGPAAPDRPVLPLPGFSLRCDGSGSCCRFYPSVVFSPLEAARARARLPLVEDAGLEQHRGFTPLAGTEDRLLAVALVDGRCAYLEADLRCGIHKHGAAEEKPLGCRVYPARFVDDGAAIRVTPWLECGCVLASGVSGRTDGDPLTKASVASALEPAIFVEQLPDRIHLGGGAELERERLAETSLDLAGVDVEDGVASLLALAGSLEAGSFADARSSLASPPAPSFGPLMGAFAAVRSRIERLAAEEWRSQKDLPRQLANALLGACDLIEAVPDELLRGPGAYRQVEAFHARALLFGHQLVHPKNRYSMASLARDRALRVLLARALGVAASLADLTDPAFGQPLALVEASARAYGFAGYLNEAGGGR